MQKSSPIGSSVHTPEFFRKTKKNRVFFSEMSLKHSACHTFRASRVPCNTPKSHLKSRKIDSVGDHISGKKHAKSVAGAVKVQSRGFTLISWIPFGSFGVL